MSNRSDELWWRLHESSEKFDYFITGVTGALFGYIAQTYTPEKIDGVIPALTPLALVFLIGSFYAGVKRIQQVQFVKNLNHEMLHNAEHAGKITSALRGGGQSYFNEETGETYERQVMEQNRIELMRRSAGAKSALVKEKPKTLRLYKWRDRLLVLGFIVIIASRVLEPYSKQGGHSPSAAAQNITSSVGSRTNNATP